MLSASCSSHLNMIIALISQVGNDILFIAVYHHVNEEGTNSLMRLHGNRKLGELILQALTTQS